VAAGGWACHGREAELADVAMSGGDPAANATEVDDVRVAVPREDPEWIDFVTPELTIEPGDERVWCAHYRWQGGDAAYDDHHIFQGRYGHHAVLTASNEPKPPGTVEDCTQADRASQFPAYAMGVKLPEGHGVFLPDGMPVVVQFHYVNYGRRPILVRDVVRLHRVPIERVTTWTSMISSNQQRDIAIPAKSSASLAFDCEVTSPGRLVTLTGHMHEQGRRIEIRHVRGGVDLGLLYAVDDWLPEYRDAPPITIFEPATAPVFEPGDVLRTRCTWTNTTSRDLGFPQEMCIGFGYLAGPKEAINCFDAPLAEM
jgi:hypothetical protein